MEAYVPGFSTSFTTTLIESTTFFGVLTNTVLEEDELVTFVVIVGFKGVIPLLYISVL